MYFDFANNGEDFDDDLYNGKLPEDFQEFVEKRCEKCAANETKLITEGPIGSMNKREFKTLRRVLYKKMVDNNLLKHIVEELVGYCPNNPHDLLVLTEVLIDPKIEKISDLRRRCQVVRKVYEKVRELYAENLELKNQKLGSKKPGPDNLVEQLIEERIRKNLRPSIRETDPPKVALKSHVCRTGCDWCVLHCTDHTALQDTIADNASDCDCDSAETSSVPPCGR